MRVVPFARSLVLVALAFSACSVDRGGLAGYDLGVLPFDAGTRDAAERDAPMADLGPRDFGTTDLGPRDLGTADLGLPDLGVDLGPPDLGPPDLGPPDLGPPDLGPPDLGPPDLGRPDLGQDLGQPDLGPPSCDSLYETAPAYRRCAERPTECEFYSRLGGSTCNARCTGLGGTCLGAYFNGFDTCARIGNDSCTATRSDQICVCSR